MCSELSWSKSVKQLIKKTTVGLLHSICPQPYDLHRLTIVYRSAPIRCSRRKKNWNDLERTRTPAIHTRYELLSVCNGWLNYHWHVHKHMQRITDVTNQVKLCSIFSVLETCVLSAQKRRSQKEWQRWPGSKQLSWCGPPCFNIWIETKVLLALGSCFRVGRTCCRWTASSYFGRKNGTYLGAVSVSLQHVQGRKAIGIRLPWKAGRKGTQSGARPSVAFHPKENVERSAKSGGQANDERRQSCHACWANWSRGATSNFWHVGNVLGSPKCESHSKKRRGKQGNTWFDSIYIQYMILLIFINYI